jgi:hypothetical protein
LRSPVEHTGQYVACHRYDPNFAEGMSPPTSAEMEERYLALSIVPQESGAGRTPA